MDTSREELLTTMNAPEQREEKSILNFSSSYSIGRDEQCRKQSAGNPEKKFAH